MLWGINKTDVNDQSEEGFWLYSIPDINWTWVKLKQSIENFPLFGFSVNYASEKCLIFGQYKATS